MNFLYIDPLGKALGTWSLEINAFSVLLRLALILLFAAIIGYERSTKRHSAGLRTFVLVAIVSCVAGIIDAYYLEAGNNLYILSAATIIGVAIMSADTTLFTSRSQIKGITTSVALFGISFLGLSIGHGLYVISVVLFVAIIITLAALPSLETYFKNRSNHFEIHLELKNASYLKDFITTIRQLGLKIDDIEQNTAYIGSSLSVYSVSLSITSKELKQYKTHSEIIEALNSIDYIYHIEEI